MKTAHKKTTATSKANLVSRATGFASENKIIIALIIVAAIAAFLFFQQPQLKSEVEVLAFDEGNRPLSGEKIVLGFFEEELFIHDEGAKPISISEKTFDANSTATFNRDEIIQAEEKNFKKGTAIFQITRKDERITFEIPQASKRADKILLKLLPTQTDLQP